MTKNLFIAGSPGVGKTSLIKTAAAAFRDRIGGFYTEQMTEGGKRMGFRIATFDGRKAVLASKSMDSPVRLNKYGVDLKALEEVGVIAIEAAAAEGKIVVVDEIGAMEALSERFRAAVLFVLQGPQPVLATVRSGTHDFSDQVKKLDQTKLVALTRSNFDAVEREVGAWLREQIQAEK